MVLSPGQSAGHGIALGVIDFAQDGEAVKPGPT